jgi:hypothetical protein
MKTVTASNVQSVMAMLTEGSFRRNGRADAVMVESVEILASTAIFVVPNPLAPTPDVSADRMEFSTDFMGKLPRPICPVTEL